MKETLWSSKTKAERSKEDAFECDCKYYRRIEGMIERGKKNREKVCMLCRKIEELRWG